MTQLPNILFVTSDKIWVNGEDPAYGWGNATLEEVLLEFKTKLNKKSVRIILDDSLTYLVNITVRDNILTRLDILEKIQTQVPEKIESGFWDYKLNDKGDVSRVVAFVVKQDFLTKFVEGLVKADLHVDASEPVSVSLARLTKDEEDAHIIIYSHPSGEGGSFILADKGDVVAVISVPDSITEDKIARFVEFARDRYVQKPTKILISAHLTNISSAEILGLPTGHIDLNPFTGIAEKKDLRGEDQKVLNLDTEKLLKPIIMPEDDHDEEQLTRKRNKKRYLLPAFIILLPLILLLVFIVTSNDSQTKISPSPTPSVVPIVTPTPEIDLNTYKIQILNGTGTAGEALAVQEQLGLTQADLKNAENYDYEFTEVKLNTNTPESVVETIQKKLQNRKVRKSAQTLTDSSEFDVVIVVGKSS